MPANPESALRVMARRFATPAVAWLVCAVTVNWVQQVAYRRSHGGGGGWSSLWPGGFAPSAGRVAWDSGLYLRVAEHGYRLSEGLEAGFPGYALLIRGLHGVVGGYDAAAVLISMASGFAATLLFWQWMHLTSVAPSARRTALALFLLYPYSFLIFGVAYSDPLLLALVLGAVVLVESDEYVAAGLVGAAATFSRPTGMVLVPALALMALWRSGALRLPAAEVGPAGPVERLRRIGRTVRGVRLDPSCLELRHFGVLLSATGVLGYMAFLWQHAGDPFYFWRLQVTDYGHPSAVRPSTWLKVGFFRDPSRDVHGPSDVVNELAATFMVGLALVTAPALSRRNGPGYAVMALGIVISIWQAETWFAPGGRYLLPVVPFIAALLAPWLTAHRRARAAVLVLSGVGALLLAIGFAGAFDVHW